ncbi:zinc-binding alcohol dehydrogenase family protein [Flaviflagellibacter deserti]|uniref:Zinc-type alcohol dehydrogenase-like protein n=1 Tax=Flaviflagellibacter deserti TaxID=2267266 RepID=A0ABV9Z2U2_9HYPH
MKATGYINPLPISDPNSLSDIEIAAPKPGSRDLLVEVKAVSVNPVDTKIRRGRRSGTADQPVVLGWDAAGVVTEIGSEVTLFKPGDEVFYAGAIERPGTNAELHVVDERIVGRKPKSLDFADAAALPLTAITAWEMLFDRMRIERDGGEGDTILIMAGAGGVGSIATQLARKLTRLTVVASASRPETIEFAKAQGAHFIVDHTKPLAEQFKEQNIPAPRYIFSTSSTARDLPRFVEIAKPQGIIGAIDDDETVNVASLKGKALGFVWEMMFARPLYQTEDMIEQHRLLNAVSELVDKGVIKTTANERLQGINAANLKTAHAKLESGRTIGKIVLESF